MYRSKSCSNLLYLVELLQQSQSDLQAVTLKHNTSQSELGHLRVKTQQTILFLLQLLKKVQQGHSDLSAKHSALKASGDNDMKYLMQLLGTSQAELAETK